MADHTDPNAAAQPAAAPNTSPNNATGATLDAASQKGASQDGMSSGAGSPGDASQDAPLPGSKAAKRGEAQSGPPPAGKGGPPKRRIVYIKKEFQLRFILKFCLIVTLGSAVSAGALYYFSSDTITSTFNNSRLAIQTTSQVILPALMYTALINLVLAGAAVAFISLYNSHKIAGPLYRFELELKKMAEGDFTRRIFLREKDQLTDLAMALNEVLGLLDGELSAVREQVREVAQALPDGPETAEARAAIARLEAAMDDQFTLTANKQSS